MPIEKAPTTYKYSQSMKDIPSGSQFSFKR